MSFLTFKIILFGSLGLSVLLALFRLLQSSTLYSRSSQPISWFAIPYPFFLGVLFLAVPDFAFALKWGGLFWWHE